MIWRTGILNEKVGHNFLAASSAAGMKWIQALYTEDGVCRLHWNAASHWPGYTDSNSDTHHHQNLKSHSYLRILYIQEWEINFISRIWRLTHAYPDVSLVWIAMGYLLHLLSQITYPEPQQLCFLLKIIILKQFLSSLLLSNTVSCYTMCYFIFTTRSPKMRSTQCTLFKCHLTV